LCSTVAKGNIMPCRSGLFAKHAGNGVFSAWSGRDLFPICKSWYGFIFGKRVVFLSV
jgi:hypothetical protein